MNAHHSTTQPITVVPLPQRPRPSLTTWISEQVVKFMVDVHETQEAQKAMGEGAIE